MNLEEKSTPELQRLDSSHYLHPFTDPKALLEKGVKDKKDQEGKNLHDLLMKYPIE